MLGIVFDLGLVTVSDVYVWKAALHFFCKCVMEIEIRTGSIHAVEFCGNHQRMLCSLLRNSLDRDRDLEKYLEIRRQLLDNYLELADRTGRHLI